MADKMSMAEEASLKKFDQAVRVLSVEADSNKNVSMVIFDVLGNIWLKIKKSDEENNIFTILNSAFLSNGNLLVHVVVDNQQQIVKAFYDVPGVTPPGP